MMQRRRGARTRCAQLLQVRVPCVCVCVLAWVQWIAGVHSSAACELSVTLICPLESGPFFGLKSKAFFRRMNVIVALLERVACALYVSDTQAIHRRQHQMWMWLFLAT